MKTLMLFLSTVVAVGFSFTAQSCSKDDPSFDGNLLVGDWYLSYHRGFYYWNGALENYEESLTEESSWFYWSFSPDGTGMSIIENGSGLPETLELLWSLSGNRLSVIARGSGEDILTVKELTPTTLTVYICGTDADGPFEFTQRFSRVCDRR